MGGAAPLRADASPRGEWTVVIFSGRSRLARWLASFGLPSRGPTCDDCGMVEGPDERIRALEAEVRRLQVMLASAPDFISRLSIDGKFLYLNRLAPGFQMEQVLGSSLDLYVPPEARAQAHAAMKAACETRTVQQYATTG